jgi:DNA-binding Xre family transcriptional regulator
MTEVNDKVFEIKVKNITINRLNHHLCSALEIQQPFLNIKEKV